MPGFLCKLLSGDIFRACVCCSKDTKAGGDPGVGTALARSLIQTTPRYRPSPLRLHPLQGAKWAPTRLP